MKQLKALENRIENRRAIIKAKIQKAHPVITDINLYTSRNIAIHSQNLSINMYEGREYTEENIKLNYSTTMTQLPTEKEAIQHVRALKTERAKFIKAMKYVQKMLNWEQPTKEAIYNDYIT